MANLPQVGLEAIIAGLPGFEAGAKVINSAYDSIEKKAANVEKASKNLSSSISSLSSPFVNLGQSVLSFGAIAGGAALVGVTALTAGIVALGASALTETAKYERMSLSINNLVAREISQGQVVEQQKQILAGLTAKETAELEKLQGGLDNEANQRDILSARIQEQKEKIRQLTDQYGENGLVVIKERAELQGMELDLSDLNQEIVDHQNRISELTGKEGQMVTVMEKVRTGQMSMTDAMTKAGPKAQELLKWIQILAIQSPFTQEGIADAFRTTLAYGFTTDAAQRLTSAMVDFTSATGKTEQSAQLIALALGQIQARGKLSAQELRQLSEQGVGTNAILERMGFSLDDVSNGLVDTDAFIEAVVQDMEIFKGSAKAQSNTLAGLQASLSDLKSIALREFFTSTFSAIRPYVANFVGWLTKATLETGQIKKMGETLGQYVGGALKTINEYATLISTLGTGAGLTIMVKLFGPEGIALWQQVQLLMSNISLTFNQWSAALSNLLPDFNQLSTGIIPSIISGLTFLNQHFEEFKGALLGIGVVIGAGVFAALVAGILALLTPINLIIAGAALLGAAWMGNWGGIQEKTFAVWAVLQPVLQQIYDWLSINIPIAVQFLADAWSNVLLPALTVVWNWLSNVWFPLQVQWYNFLGVTLVEAITSLSAYWTNTLLPAITAVSSYLSANVVPLFQSFNDFIVAVFNKTVQVAAGLWKNILYPALRDIYNIVSSSLQPIFKNLGSTISEDVSPFLGDLGEKILPMLTDGLKTVTKWIKEATDFFKGLAQAVEKFELPDVLKPGSPPPFAIALDDIANSAGRASLGVDKFQRLLTGIDTSSGEFLGTASKIMQASIDFTNSLKMAGVGNIAQMARNVFKGFTAQIVRSGEAGQLTAASLQTKLINYLKLYNKNVPATLNYFKQQGLSFEFLANQLNTSFGDFMKELRLQAITEDIGLAGRFASFGQAVTERLNNDIDTLQKIINGEASYYHNQILSNVEAQELLNQKLAEQAKVQKEITALAQQQADLQFLQQQVDIIKLIEERGLQAGDIFQGITFGLGASLPDLITATSRVVQAMIDQVNKDLQIGSPSRVMFGKFQQAGIGAVQGLLSTIPAIQGAMSQIIDVPLGQANANSYSNQTVNNNYFNLGVTTTSTPQATLMGFQNMRAMLS